MEEIRFYNTLTHRIETFEPLEPPHVYVYTCGPTVYDYQHIGNFKTFLFADVLRRFLDLCGFTVHQVMNLTDVGHMTDDQIADGSGEDKMQVASRRLKEAKKQGTVPAGAVADPDDPYQIADFYTSAFIEDARLLGVKIADEYPQQTPRATDHVQSGMIPMIQKLLERGHAYVAQDGVVYYSVESFPTYGCLSGNTLEQVRSGAGGRVLAEHQSAKRHPADFMLWKPDPSHLMKWDSPWGAGYPNWHIECSVMATALHGRDIIDIHTGGEDNIFPHHECEIAQTCGATGQDLFARFWMHSRHLRVDGQKMSKSKGSFYTVRDVTSGGLTGRPVDPKVLRYDLLKAHYRSNLNFTKRGLADSAVNVRRIREAEQKLREQANGAEVQISNDHPTVRAFMAALGDDLNMSSALAEVSNFVRARRGDAAERLAVLKKLDTVLGVLDQSNGHGDQWAADRCRQIDEARVGKDFVTADLLRQELIDADYEVRTTPEGTAATKKLA